MHPLFNICMRQTDRQTHFLFTEILCRLHLLHLRLVYFLVYIYCFSFYSNCVSVCIQCDSFHSFYIFIARLFCVYAKKEMKLKSIVVRSSPSYITFDETMHQRPKQRLGWRQFQVAVCFLNLV